MKAMVLRAFNQAMSLDEVEDPKPGPDDVVLRVTACGVCGTDLKIVSGKLPSSIITLPHIPGHEIAGEIVEIGSAVKTVSRGQKGVAYLYVGCRDCEMCRTGNDNVCLSVKRLGFELPGGFAEFVRLPSFCFCPFSESMACEQMAVLPDAVATSYHALKTMGKVSMGQDVLIVGIGGLGIHAVQIAKLMGARVIVADKRSGALEMAVTYGADFTVNTADEDPLEIVMGITKGRGVDAVIEIVGLAETLKWSLNCLRRQGRLVIVGYDPSRSFPIHTMDFHYNEWTLCGSRISTRQELLELIALVERGKIVPVISERRPWKEANGALEVLSRKETSGRTVLTFD